MNTLTNYFQERLVEAGFPADLKLEWSLNYRQDKGHVAFYGDISYQDLFNLFNYVYPNKKYKHQRLEHLIRSIFGMEGHISIVKNAFYSRGMEVNTPCSKDFLWNDFVHDLWAYIQDVSCQLESEGYKILKDMNIFA